MHQTLGSQQHYSPHKQEIEAFADTDAAVLRNQPAGAYYYPFRVFAVACENYSDWNPVRLLFMSVDLRDVFIIERIVLILTNYSSLFKDPFIDGQ